MTKKHGPIGASSQALPIAPIGLIKFLEYYSIVKVVTFKSAYILRVLSAFS